MKIKKVDISDYVIGDVYVVVTAIEGDGYALEALSPQQIEDSADDGASMFFNLLANDSQKADYDEIVLSLINGDHDITYITTMNDSIVVFFKKLGDIYETIDKACAPGKESPTTQRD